MYLCDYFVNIKESEVNLKKQQKGIICIKSFVSGVTCRGMMSTGVDENNK